MYVMHLVVKVGLLARGLCFEAVHCNWFGCFGVSLAWDDSVSSCYFRLDKKARINQKMNNSQKRILVPKE